VTLKRCTKLIEKSLLTGLRQAANLGSSVGISKSQPPELATAMDLAAGFDRKLLSSKVWVAPEQNLASSSRPSWGMMCRRRPSSGRSVPGAEFYATTPNTFRCLFPDHSGQASKSEEKQIREMAIAAFPPATAPGLAASTS